MDIISNLNLSDQAGNHPGGLTGCNVAVDSSLFSSDNEFYGSDAEPGPMLSTNKRLKRTPSLANFARVGMAGFKGKRWKPRSIPMEESV